jgi:outer membrane protein assembly factor BamB
MIRRLPGPSLVIALGCLAAGCGARSELGGTEAGTHAVTPAAPAGPWPMRGHDPQNRGRGAAPTIASPVERWSFPVLDASGDVSFAEPAIAADGTIYLQRGNAGTLTAVGPDGTLKWEAAQYATDGGSSESSPALGADGSIYVGGGARLVAFDPGGQIAWTLPTASTVRGSPVVLDDGTITFGDDSGHLYAADASGTLAWSLTLDDTVSLAQWTPAAAPDGTLYATVGNVLRAVVDGAVVWSAMLDDASNQYPQDPSVADDGTIVVPVSGQVFAFQPGGAPRWTFALDAVSGASITAPAALGADGTAYVSMDVEVPFSGAVVAVGPGGEQAWSATTEFSAGPMPATVASDGNVYTTDPVQIVLPSGTVEMTGIPAAQAITRVVIGAGGTFYLVFGGALHAFGP